jgi:hypothetical protein
VDLAQGDAKNCSITLVAPISRITVVIWTGGDDLRANSSATLSIGTQTLVLKSKGQPAWNNGQQTGPVTFSLNPPIRYLDIGPISINLIQGTGSSTFADNWNIARVVIDGSTSECIVSRVFTPELRLTKDAPSGIFIPDDPSDECPAQSPLGYQAAPTFSMPSGVGQCPRTVSLSLSAGPGQPGVFFTTDGTRPTANSFRYVGSPITITPPETINAIALNIFDQRSTMTGASYGCTQTTNPCPAGEHLCIQVGKGGVHSFCTKGSCP